MRARQALCRKLRPDHVERISRHSGSQACEPACQEGGDWCQGWQACELHLQCFVNGKMHCSVTNPQIGCRQVSTPEPDDSLLRNYFSEGAEHGSICQSLPIKSRRDGTNLKLKSNLEHVEGCRQNA